MAIEELTKQSQDNISRLLARVTGRKSCAFVGAGLSQPAGYPSWHELMDILKAESEKRSGEKIDDSEQDFYDRAENYRSILGEEYQNILKREFDPKNDKQPWLPVHRDLVEMPFVSYITTNYDCLLEEAHRALQREPVYNCYPILPTTHARDGQIFHIHGIIDHTRIQETLGSIILTRSDIVEAYAPGSYLVDLLKHLYSELTIFFVGFNVRDPIMMKILEISKSAYEETNKIAVARGAPPLGNSMHYALLPYPPTKRPDRVLLGPDDNPKINLETANAEDEELRLLGVNTIRYTADTYHHTQAISIIHDIHARIMNTPELSIHQDLTFYGG